MALPEFRAVGEKAAAKTTNEVEVKAPAGVATGDLELLVATTVPAGSVTISSNGGGAWTPVAETPIDVTAGEKLYAWYRVRAGGDGSPKVKAGGDHVCAGRFAYKAGTFDTVDPFEVEKSGSETTSDKTFSFAPGNSTEGTERLCIVICSSGVDSNTGQAGTDTANTSLTSINLRAEYQTAEEGGGGFWLADAVRATAGSVGTWTQEMVSNTPKAYVSVALKPVPPAKTGTSAVSATGSLTGSGVKGAKSTSAASAAGSLTATASTARNSASTVSASASLSASASKGALTSSAASGASSVSGQGAKGALYASTVSTEGSFSAQAASARSASSAAAGSTSVAGTGTKAATTASTVGGTATITSGTLKAVGGASSVGGEAITAFAGTKGAISSSAVAGTGLLQAAASKQASASSAVTGGVEISSAGAGTGEVVASGSSVVIAEGLISSAGHKSASAASSPTGAVELSAVARKAVSGVSTLSGAASISSLVATARRGASAVSGSSVVSATGGVAPHGQTTEIHEPTFSRAGLSRAAGGVPHGRSTGGFSRSSR